MSLTSHLSRVKASCGSMTKTPRNSIALLILSSFSLVFPFLLLSTSNFSMIVQSSIVEFKKSTSFPFCSPFNYNSNNNCLSFSLRKERRSWSFSSDRSAAFIHSSSYKIHHINRWKKPQKTISIFKKKRHEEMSLLPLFSVPPQKNQADSEEGSSFSLSLDKESHQKLSNLLDDLHLLDDPTIEDYNRVLKECSLKEGKQYMETCMWLLEELVEIGLSPDVNSYLHALGACKVNKEYEEAISLLREMKQNEDTSCQPNLEAYTIVIETLHEANIPGQIRWMLDEMEVRKIQPNVKLYNLAIEAAASTFDVFRARREKLDVPSDEEDTMESAATTTTTTVTTAAAGNNKTIKTENKDELQRLSTKLKEVGHNFVDAQIDGDVARGLFYDMERKGIEPNVDSYKFLLGAYTKQGIPAYMTRAQDIITEMTLQKGLDPNKECYMFLEEGYAQLGEEYVGQRDACKQMVTILSGQAQETSEKQTNSP